MERLHAEESVPAPESARAASAQPADAARALALQRQIGNRATQQALQRGMFDWFKEAFDMEREVQVEGETVIVKTKAEKEEARAIIKRIESTYGVDISAVKGVKATVDAYAKAPQSERDKVKVAPWLMRELRATERAIKHYKPILGMSRVLSTRAKDTQEVATIGKANFSITTMSDKGVIDPLTLGEYYRSSKTFAIYKPGENYVQDLGTVDKQLEGTVIHELAHGLMYYALPDFVKVSGFWLDARTQSKAKDAEPPCTKYGEKSASEDQCETMRWYFLLPDKLEKKCPKRYAWAKAQIEGWTPKPPVGDFPTPDPDGTMVA